MGNIITKCGVGPCVRFLNPALCYASPPSIDRAAIEMVNVAKGTPGEGDAVRKRRTRIHQEGGERGVRSGPDRLDIEGSGEQPSSMGSQNGISADCD
jgi:hypothetical protein